MPVASNFETTRLQVSLFTPGLELRTPKAFAYFLQHYPDKFDGEPEMIPSVPNLPAEFPRLTLRSADKQLTLKIAPSRIDMIREERRIPEGQSIEFVHWAAALGIDYLNAMAGKAGRLACLITRMASDATPAMTLSRHFCQERWLGPAGPLNRPADFHLHAHKRFRFLDRFEINSWFRCKTAARVRQEGTAPSSVLTHDLIVVEQDFNSLPEEVETREFTGDEINAFFQGCLAELRHVLELYFP